MTVAHPAPRIIASQLRDLAAQLDQCAPHDRRQADVGLCRCLDCAAELLAARGWPPGTLGSGSRSADTTSSTERAAGVNSDTTELVRDEYAILHEDLAKHLRLIWSSAGRLVHLIGTVRSQAPTDDPVPVGTGHCVACTRFCRPDARRPDNRLKAGLCPACWASWMRWRRTHPAGIRSDFITWRKAELSGQQAEPLPDPAPARLRAVDRDTTTASTPPVGYWGWVVRDADHNEVDGPFRNEAQASAARDGRDDAALCDVSTRWVDGAA